MAAIVAKLKLTQILRKMLAADVDMGAVYRALLLCPEALYRIDAAAVRSRLLPLLVMHGDVIEAQHVEEAI